MRRERQQPLFVLKRELTDAERTVLEAIAARGPVTAREVGKIVYRLRGYRSVLGVRRSWVTGAGRHVLGRLEEQGLVRRTRANRWTRGRGVTA